MEDPARKSTLRSSDQQQEEQSQAQPQPQPQIVINLAAAAMNESENEGEEDAPEDLSMKGREAMKIKLCERIKARKSLWKWKPDKVPDPQEVTKAWIHVASQMGMTVNAIKKEYKSARKSLENRILKAIKLSNARTWTGIDNHVLEVQCKNRRIPDLWSKLDWLAKEIADEILAGPRHRGRPPKKGPQQPQPPQQMETETSASNSDEVMIELEAEQNSRDTNCDGNGNSNNVASEQGVAPPPNPRQTPVEDPGAAKTTKPTTGKRMTTGNKRANAKTASDPFPITPFSLPGLATSTRNASNVVPVTLMGIKQEDEDEERELEQRRWIHEGPPVVNFINNDGIPGGSRPSTFYEMQQSQSPFGNLQFGGPNQQEQQPNLPNSNAFGFPNVGHASSSGYFPAPGGISNGSLPGQGPVNPQQDELWQYLISQLEILYIDNLGMLSSDMSQMVVSQTNKTVFMNPQSRRQRQPPPPPQPRPGPSFR